MIFPMAMKLYVLVTVLLLTHTTPYAQFVSPAVINTSGGTVPINNFTLEWSVGEMPLVSTMQNGIVVTNGLLQPFTNMPTANTNNTFGPEEIRVSPNPTNSFVEINFLSTQKGRVYLRLYNGMGQLIFQNQFHSNGVGYIERIDMQHRNASTYFLQVTLEPQAGFVRKKGGYKIIKL